MGIKIKIKINIQFIVIVEGTCTEPMKCIFRISHLSKLGSERRVSYDTAPLEQEGLRVLLKDPTVVDLPEVGLEPRCFWSSD